jgi:predicted nuclease of predicted toxin-antitoxin system
MPDIRFLMDVHVHSAITAGLRRRGVEVLTCQEAGLARTPDEEIVAFAAENNWVVFSQDDDFLKICAFGERLHKGLVYSHKRNSISRIIAGLMLVYEILEALEMENHVEFV